MSYLNTPQAGAPTTHLAVSARRWAPLIGFLAGLLVLTLIGALASLRGAAQAEPTSAIILVATPTMPPAVPTAAPRPILGYFDYDNPRSAVALMAGDVVRITGQAGGFRLVELVGGGRVWLAIADVPQNTPADSPLPDLAPPTVTPAPTIIYVTVPAVVEPTAETHFEAPSDRPGPPTATPPPLLDGERLSEYFKRTGVTPVAAQQVR